jgi:hypothetical protein
MDNYAGYGSYIYYSTICTFFSPNDLVVGCIDLWLYEALWIDMWMYEF